MESSENLWIAATIALAVGIVVGIVLTQLARRFSGGTPTGTQAQLESLQLRFEEYQQEVSSHFKTTASLVSRLNRSYQDIQDHLTQGAVELSPDDITRQHLLAALEENPSASRRSHGQNDAEPVFDSLEPPRDYAPKLQDSPGTLSEDYGITRRS
ncbi:MAG: YhcB family protein [Pseudomonas sp.]